MAITLCKTLPALGQQSRVRLAQEVTQINLDNFISPPVFDDNAFALGNPDIRPAATAVAEPGVRGYFLPSAPVTEYGTCVSG